MGNYYALELSGSGDTITWDSQETEVRWIGANAVGSIVFPYKPYFNSSTLDVFNIFTFGSTGPKLEFNGTNSQIRFYPDQQDSTNYCQVADTVIDSVAFVDFIVFYCAWDYANDRAVLRVGGTSNAINPSVTWSSEYTGMTFSGLGVVGEIYYDGVYRTATGFDRWEAGSAYKFDDFADADGTTKTAGQAFTGRNAAYPTWTVTAGTFRLNNTGTYYLDKSAAGAATDSIYIADTNFTDVIWETDFKLGGTTSSHGISINLINEVSRTGTADGYCLTIQGDNIFKLYRVDNNAETVIIEPSGTDWTADTNVHNAKIIRRRGNRFEIVLDGVSKGFAYDATYTSLTNVVVEVYTTSAYIDNFHIRHTHSKEFNEVLNMGYDSAVLTAFTDKTYSICKFRYIDNSNTENIVDIGRVVLGAYSTLTKNYDIGYTEEIQDLSSVQESEAGNYFFLERNLRQKFSLTFTRVTDAQDETVQTLLESIKGNKPIIISIDPDDHAEECFYVRLITPLSRTRGILKKSSFVLSFEELL